MINNGMSDFIWFMPVLLILFFVGLRQIIKKFDLKNKKTIIKISIIGSIIVIFLSGYLCFRDVYIKQDVNIEPLINLELPSNITSAIEIFKDKSVFRSYKIIDFNGINIYTNSPSNSDTRERATGYYSKNTFSEVTIELYDTTERAKLDYEWTKSSYKERYKLQESKSNNDYSYCITYVKQTRTDPEGGSELSNSYVSYVTFQKNNLVITMHEDKRKGELSDYNDLIQDLAKCLSAEVK